MKTPPISRETFEDYCSRARRDLVEQMLELVRKHVTSYEELKEISEGGDDEYENELLEYYDIERYLGEVGCPICESPDGSLFLGKCEAPCTGAGCTIDYHACRREGGRHVGSFHTHPLGGVTPSYPDLEHSRRTGGEIISCIGGFDGKTDRVTCYTPNERSREYGFFVDILKGTYYPMDRQFSPDGKIRFYREPPPPTPGDILEDLHRDDIRRIVTCWGELDDARKRESVRKEIEKRVDRFIEELESGEIPQEYWDGYESPEGEMDELEYYSPETLYKLEQDRRAFLRRDVYLCDL